MPYASPNSAEYAAAVSQSSLMLRYVNEDVDGTFPRELFYDLSGRVYNIQTSRGRNYELGRAESGVANLRIDNSDGLLTPSNTASPLYGNIKPYRPLYINALHNGSSTVSTGNIINDTNVNDFDWTYAPTYALPITVDSNDSNFETSATNNWFVCAASGTSSTVSAVARQTTYKWSGTYAAQVVAAADNYVLLDIPVVAGQTYTFSSYTTRSASTLTQVVFDGAFYIGKTPIVSTTMTTSATNFTRNSSTFTATSPRVAIGYRVPSGQTLRFDGVQLEVGSSASTYTTTGPTVYPLFSGFVERYPQSWQAPNRSESNLTAVDVLAPMSQVTMSNLYFADTLLNSPIYYYPLNSETDALYTANYSAFNQNPLAVTTDSVAGGGLGAGTFAFGNDSSVTAIPAAATQCPTFYSVAGTSGTTTFLQTSPLNDITFVPNFGTTTETFSFECWFQPNSVTGSNAIAPIAIEASDGTYLFSVSSLLTTLSVSAGSASRSYLGLEAGAWYYLVASVAYNNATKLTTLKTYLRGGAYTGGSVLSTTATQNITNPARMNVGRTTNGQVAHIAIYKGDITAQGAARYELGSAALYGERLDTQFNKLFDVAGFTYPIISAEQSVSYGQELNWIQDSTLFDGAQTVADTESSNWFAAASGEVVFRNRRYRQQQFVNAYSFADDGTNTAYNAAEVTVNYDPTYVLNDITITRNGGVLSNAYNSDSVVAYFPRTYSRTIYNTSDLEAIDCAFYLLDRYQEPATRIEAITLTPARNPSVWQTALDVEIDDLVGALKELNVDATSVPISDSFFVERIEHLIDGQTGDWQTRLSLSPQLRSYNQLGAFQNKLTAAVAVGATSMQIRSIDQTGLNLIYNGSIELSANGWSNLSNATLAQSSFVAWTGSDSLRLTAIASATMTAQQTLIPVTAGTAYTFSGYVRASSTTRSALVSVHWYDNAGSLISTSTGSASTDSNSAWGRRTVTGTAPANAVYANAVLQITSAAAGEIHYWDGMQFEIGSAATTWQESKLIDPTSIVLGSMFSLDTGATTREVVAVTSATEASGVLTIGFTVVDMTKQSTLAANYYPDDTTLTYDTTNSTLTGLASYLIGTEIMTGSIPVLSILSVTRGTSGTQPQPIYLNEPIYQLAGSAVSAHSIGATVSDYVPNNSLTLYHDNIDTTLLTIQTGGGTTTTPASGFAYTSLNFAQLPDYNNVPSSDFAVGQLVNLVNSAAAVEPAVFAMVSGLGTSGNWTGYFYPIASDLIYLTTDMSLETATVTGSSIFPVGTKAVLIDNELMSVVSGTGTATIGVVRGTPDATVWNTQPIQPHKSNNATTRIYLVTSSAGLANSYVSGGTARVTLDSVSDEIRLAY